MSLLDSNRDQEPFGHHRMGFPSQWKMEKPKWLKTWQGTDSDYEDELPKHSFVNHYMSDPTYYNSWKRQQKGTKHSTPYRYEERVASEAEPYFQTVITTQSSGGVYTPTGQPAPGSRTPVTGFSSFV